MKKMKREIILIIVQRNGAMEKLNVLLITGKVTIEHDYREINQYLRTLLESTGRFDVRITEEFDGCTETTLKPYDVILLNYDGRDFPTDAEYKRWSPVTEKAFFDFVKAGKGLVIFHSSAWIDEDLPEEYKKLWGLYLTTPSGGRKNPKDDFTMHIESDAHPITQGIAKSCSIVGDDFFAGVIEHPDSNVTVLATVYDDVENYRVPYFPPPHHPVVIPEGKLENMIGVNTDQPVFWTNTYGKGRVFGTTLGHGIETLRRVPFLTMLCRGTEWAATGAVTLAPPDRSGENRLRKWPYYSK